MDPSLPGQIGRQSSAAMAFGWTTPRPGCGLFLRGVALSGGPGILVGLFGKEEHLVRVESLRLRPVDPAQEQVEAVLQLLDPPLRLAVAGGQLADHAVA